MLELILLFMLLALALYIIFGGADFGAGMLELFCPKERRSEFRELINRTIGPVWEANHIWLILVVVILFSVFPPVFRQISVSFHFLLLLMLVGIVLRGCAFAFRHYDAVKDSSQEYYSVVFAVSSLLTPFCQGMVAGGIIMGRISDNPVSFQSAYLTPYLNAGCLTLGAMFCFMCALTAAVFLYCENTAGEFAEMLLIRIRQCSLGFVVSGISVFPAFSYSGFPLTEVFFSDFLSLAALIAAVLFLLLLNLKVANTGNRQLSRAVMVGIITLVLGGWWKIQYPGLIGISGISLKVINLYDVAAPELVQKQVVIALVAGSCLIFPALFYLFRVFKFKPES